MQIVLSEYIAKLEDDCNMPEALAEFHTFITFINTNIANKTMSTEEANSLMDMLKTFNQVLGIMDFSILDKKEEKIPMKIQQKLEERDTAKQEKDFETADKLRDELEEAGYKIIDSKDGSRLEKI